MKSNKTFGELIKSLREEKKLTLREVAGKLQIDISMLGKIEKNKRKPTKELISKLSIIFNVDSKDLIVSFLSDSILYQILDAAPLADEALKVAEEKLKYLKNRKN